MQQQLSLADAIVSITNTYGVDILKDSNRFCAILGDIAPTLDKERKIIRRAKDEDVLPLVWEAYSADATKRENILSRIECILKSEAGFSEEWCQMFINGFSVAFAWAMPAKVSTPTPSTVNPLSTKKKYFTRNVARNMFSSLSKQIILPKKYNVVGEGAFEYVGKKVHVDSITIPDGYVEIQEYAFHFLEIDQFISIPDSVVGISDDSFKLGKYAYVQCSPSSYAYQYCTEHNLRNTVDGIPEKPKYPRLFKENAASIQPIRNVDELASAGLHTLIIPKGTASIEQGAFRNRDDFDVVIADDNLKFIKRGAFSNCKSLQCVVLDSKNLSIASEAFSGCINLRVAYLFVNGDYLKGIHGMIGDDTDRLAISDTAFLGCSKLKYIVSNDYSTELDQFCETNHITYIYEDHLLNKQSRAVLPADLKQLEMQVFRLWAKLW